MPDSENAADWLEYYRSTRPPSATRLWESFQQLSKDDQIAFLFNMAAATGAHMMMMLRDHGYFDDDDERIGHA